MGANGQDLTPEGLEAITRRRLLKGAGALALTATGAPLLSACGANSGGSSKSIGGKALPKTGKATGGVTVADLREMLGVTDADAKALNGKEWKLGLVTALTGPGAEYGRSQGNGFKLAAAHIAQITGLKIQTQILDHKSGDPQAGAQAARQLGGDGFGAVMSSYNGDEGAMQPGLKQYKMMSFDPGGGTSVAFEGVPYFWGFRANTPNDPFPGSFQYVKTQLPQAKRVAFVVWDLGSSFVGKIEDGLKQALQKDGLTFVGTQTVPIGATDVSGVLSKVKTANPDIVQIATYGTDPGYFMKQYAQSGIDAQVIGAEFTYDAQKIAGSAYDKYWFASDYFDFQKPSNPLSKVFISAYKDMFGKAPNLFYEPNYYEGTLALMTLATRVAGKGGDINDGSKLQDACQSDPVFKSVYGGDDQTVGEVRIDPKTHTPVRRTMGTFAVQHGTPTPLAFYDIGGADYKVVKKPAAVG